MEKLLILFITINNDKKNKNDLTSKHIINELIKEKYQVSFIYLVKEEENHSHYHLILGIKCLLEVNDNFKLNILNELKEELSWDIVINKLNKFEIIKQKFSYLVKESYSIDNNKNNLNTHILVYEEYLKQELHIFLNFLKEYIQINEIKGLHINNTNFGSVHNNNLKENTKETTLNLIKWYFLFHGIKYKNGFLFKKIKEANHSYVQYDSIKWIKNNYIEIYKTLLENFFLNIKGISIDDLLLKNKINNEEIDLILKNLPSNYNIELCFDIIEFNNGYYFFKYNKFITKKYIESNNLSLNLSYILLKHYNSVYNRRIIPIFWKNIVLITLNNNKEKLEIICAYIANTIHKNKDIFEKKKVLYIWGDSSTGKTTVIAKPLWKYFGDDNIGILSGSKNFALENLVNKELAILDEYKFNKKRRETDLKLFEGQTILEDAKYKEQQKIKELNIIVLSNFSINPEDYEKNEETQYKKNTDIALFNRTNLIKFFSKEEIKNPINLTSDYIKKIEKEDPYILIYCNRIYHKKYIKNTAKTSQKNINELLLKNNFLEKNKTAKIKKIT